MGVPTRPPAVVQAVMSSTGARAALITKRRTARGSRATGRSITPAPVLALPSSASVSTDNWKRFKAATVDLLAQRTPLAVARSHGSVQTGATRSTQLVAMIAAIL